MPIGESLCVIHLYLTEEPLARIKYDPRTIRNQLKDVIFIEGTHYIRPFGGRKLLFLWEPIVEVTTSTASFR